MFAIFKRDPIKKLRKEYDQKLEQAMLSQRSGNLRLFADLTQESEDIWKKIQILEEQKNKK